MRSNGSSIGFLVLSTSVVVLVISGGACAGEPKERVLYRFQGGADGSAPNAAMIADRSGNLYGTTDLGGGGHCAGGCGTVFALSAPAQRGGSWTESVIYALQGGHDGANPEFPLIADERGNLYGTTSQGGDGNCGNQGLTGCGIVFELKRPQAPGAQWSEAMLYTFQGNPRGRGNGDLAWPNGIVFAREGDLYGFAYGGGACTTDETGTYCNGGAFALKKPAQGETAWRESVIYRFKSPSGSPAAPIFDASGNLYGTAPGGAYGYGGVFELSPPAHGRSQWTQSSVYEFTGGSDGGFPLPGLVFDRAGNLYDVTNGTGSVPANLFELSPAQGGGWTPAVLWNFIGGIAGYDPARGPVVGRNSRLFGTTQGGGQNDIGIVYKLEPGKQGWSQVVLHSFAGGSDGAAPTAGLVIGKDNALYGTTVSGGNTGCTGGAGCGTVFRVLP